MITMREGEINIGGNASAEEAPEELQEGETSVNNVVHTFRLAATQFDKKSYLTYLKGYMKAVKAHLAATNPDRVPVFEKNAAAFAKKVIGSFKDYEFYSGESMNPDGMIALLNYREDGTTPYFIFWKDGMKAVKIALFLPPSSSHYSPTSPAMLPDLLLLLVGSALAVAPVAVEALHVPFPKVPRRHSWTQRSTSSALSFPERQNSPFFSKGFGTPEYAAAVNKAVAANREGLMGGLFKGVTQSYISKLGGGNGWGSWKDLKKLGSESTSGAWDFKNQKIRGVNLGGWLVIEPFITPSLFDDSGNFSAVDEWTYSEALGRSEATSRLSSHWQSWITQSDIQNIANAGLNHVRIGIGYWAFDISGGEPYVQGQYPWLLKAIEWCREAGLRVIVDIHGAPGSQNGQDNSGHRGSVGWHLKQSNVNRTLAVVQTLATKFSESRYSSVVTAIQLLNEPAGWDGSALLSAYKKFAYQGYEVVRYPSSSTPSPVALSLHDAFESLDSWKDFMPASNFSQASLDTHVYNIFSVSGVALSLKDRIKSICDMSAYLSRSNANMPTIVGEWGPAITDCAVGLNGRGIGSRYNGTFPKSSPGIGDCSTKTGTGATFTQEYKDDLRRYWEVQSTVYENTTAGYLMWTWKTESAADWSMQAGLAGGWISQDPTERKFDNPCT
ncbi:glucan 1,3-beta-glucosidase, partial [Phenoliferia sp. Uapishka_3]